MPFVLDLIYLLVVLLALPWLAWQAIFKGKYRDGFAEKLLGQAPKRISEKPCIWFHAVSLGEVLLLRRMIGELQSRHPDWEVFLSTTTATGLAAARQSYPDLVTFYAPLDFSWATREAVHRVRPTVMALVELELWPNLIAAANKSGSKVAVINGRLSANSHRGYKRLGRLLRPTLKRLDIIAAQNHEYADRFADLGITRDRITVTGSVKHDNLESDRGNSKTRDLRLALGISPSDIVFVAGSTMEGEEDAALSAYQDALKVHPNLRLIIVPRHPHRFDSIADSIERRGFSVLRRSRGVKSQDHSSVVLVDTMGELGAVWGLADIAFVGGSLFPGRGGQNMMEPAAYGASVMFGPHTENFRKDVETLLTLKAARVVQSPAELATALIADLNDPEAAAERGEIARDYARSQQGAAKRAIASLERLTESSSYLDHQPHFQLNARAVKATV